jgi:hypothetical protein
MTKSKETERINPMRVLTIILAGHWQIPTKTSPHKGTAGRALLAMVEAVFGMFYVTLLTARLVSLYSFKAPVEAVHIEEMQTTQESARE